MRPVIGLAMAAAALTVLSCGKGSPTSIISPNISPAQALKTAESCMKIKFPQGARVLGYSSTIGSEQSFPVQDHYIQIKVEMRRDDLDAFVKGSLFAGKQLGSCGRSVLTIDPATWWDPSSPQKFLSGEAELPGGELLRILIDLDREDNITAYLVWHET